MIGPILGGAARQKYGASSANIVFDGNSLVAGTVLPSPSTQNIAAQLKPMAPLNGAVNMVNIGVGGHTIAQMAAHGADSNYVAGKRNILIAWEGTNSICNTSMTGQAAGAAMAAYCADRLAAHPSWAIVLMTTIPRFDAYGSSWTVSQLNNELLAYDAYLRANWKAMGAKALLDVRASGLFACAPGAGSMPTAMAPYMIDQIHYNPAGGAILAGYVAAALKRLPAR